MKIFDVIWKVSVLSALVVFGCMIVSSQEDIYSQSKKITLTKFEYKVEWISDYEFGKLMNIYGISRWELVTARRAQGKYDAYGYECIFKKAENYSY